MMILAFFLLVVAFVGATPSAIGNHNDVPSSTLGSRKQMDTSLYCGNWATGSRASAEALQKQLLACDDNTWGQSFTVKGTDDGEAGEPSPCIGLACDYVSAKDFHHTQFQLCNVSTCISTQLVRFLHRASRSSRRRCAYNSCFPRMAHTRLPRTVLKLLIGPSD